jgi:hypothetical protein
VNYAYPALPIFLRFEARLLVVLRPGGHHVRAHA